MSVGLNHASNQSIRPFKSSEEYIYAMKEDLAEWLGDLYGMDIDACNILEALETGTVLCEHANIVTQVAREFIQKFGMVHQIRLPMSGVTFVDFAQPATFLARDNISNFINWCRTQMDIKDVLMFETNDLVQRKNEKNVVLCLLEVARRASRFGMAGPVLIQLEEEIEEEMREDLELPCVEVTPQAKPQRRTSNTQNLDQMVQHLISRCTCPLQFPMVKVSEGKYKVGDSNTIIFIRILRNHVMVRVGGGWDTLEHYLDKHDPCRCTSITHKLTQRPSTPVHEIKGRLSPSPGRTQQPATLLLSRHAQAPVQSVVWTPITSSSTARTSARASGRPYLNQGDGTSELVRHCVERRPGEPDHRDTLRTPSSGSRTSSSSLNRELRAPSPSRLRQSMSTPALINQQDDSRVNSSTRTGREVTRSTPTDRLTSSFPRPVPRSSTPQPRKTLTQPQPQRARTPLVFQKTCAQLQRQPQLVGDSRLTQTWTKSQFVSKLRQSSMPSVCSTASASSLALQRQAGCSTPRPANPVRGHSPVRNTPEGFRQPSAVAKIQQPKEMSCLQNRSGFIRTFCPSYKRNENSSERHFTPLGGGLTDSPNKQPTINYQTTALANNDHIPKGSVQARARHDNVFETAKVSHELQPTTSSNDGEIQADYLIVPPPISPAQEASLYQSLEHEILANLQQLSMDSDNSSPPKDNPTKINSHHRASWRERSHGGLEMDSGRSKPPWTEAGYDAVIAELSQGKTLLQNVCMESWASSFAKDQSNKKVPKLKHAACSGQSVNTKPSLTGSWSSADSSVESMKQQSDLPTSPYCENEPSVTKHSTTMCTSNYVNSMNNSDHPHGLRKSKAGSIRPRRSLRKPDRVPSIYKLRFRSRARPRHEHRPGRKPSRIPTPVTYRESVPTPSSYRESVPPPSSYRESVPPPSSYRESVPPPSTYRESVPPPSSYRESVPTPSPYREEPCERGEDAQREVHVGKSREEAPRLNQTSMERSEQRADTNSQSASQYTIENQEEESWV